MNIKQTVIGYIGLGTMGSPMAGHLLSAGYTVWSVRHRSPTPSALLDKGIRIAPNLADLAKHCTVIFTNLPDAPDIERVIFGGNDSKHEDTLFPNLANGTIMIDNSTISPEAAKNIALRLSTQGIDFVDAPVSGGVVGAKDAKLTIMVGATEALYNKVLPLLSILGNKVTRVGNTGAGQICKAANQIAIAGALGGVAECLTFAKKNGVDPVLVREVLMGGAAGSKVLEFQGGRMTAREFSAKFSTKLFRKDLGIVLDNAEANALSLPFTAYMVQCLQAQKANGDDDLDTAAVIRVWEKLSGM